MTIQIKPNAIVFCDASVLYQAQIRDLLLELCVHQNIFKLRWSERVQNEWINKLSKCNNKVKTSLENTRNRMEHAVPECLVHHYELIEEYLQLPDPNDRHVLAAAIHSKSDYLLTENLKDFPKSTLSHYEITIISVDDFFYSITKQYQEQLIQALKNILRRLKNPPITDEDWCLRMSRIGFPKSSKLILESCKMF